MATLSYYGYSAILFAADVTFFFRRHFGRRLGDRHQTLLRVWWWWPIFIQECRVIAGRTAQCRWKFRYASNF